MASRFIMPTADVGKGLTPSDGAKLSFFITGTSTPKDTFTTEAATTPNANPVVADSNGVFPDIFITGTYKVTLTDKNDVQAGFGEADPVSETVSVGDSNNDLRYGPVFATVAAMTAGSPVSLDGLVVDLVAGMVIAIDDYATGNNSGIMFGRVVAAATGTADGGSYIDLANGTQFEQNFPAKVSSKLFGAKVDGATDDTTVYQAALDAVTHVFSPPGTARLSRINPNSNNILSGAGKASILKRIDNAPGNTEGMVDISGKNSAVVRDLKVDSNKAIQVNVKLAGVKVDTASTDCLVENVESINSNFVGIWLDASDNNTVRGCLVDSVDSAGIYLNASDRCLVIGNEVGNSRDGIFLTDCNRVRISDNDCHDGIKAGIAVDNQLTPGDGFCTVSGNVCTDNADDGINIFESNHNTVTGNVCTGNNVTGFAGVGIVNGSKNNIVSGNQCIDNDYGIRLFPETAVTPTEPSDENTIEGNFCFRNNLAGIRVFSSKRNSITNNYVLNNSQAGVGSAPGILLEGDITVPSTNNNISNNYIYDNNGTPNHSFGIQENTSDHGDNNYVNNFIEGVASFAFRILSVNSMATTNNLDPQIYPETGTFTSPPTQNRDVMLLSPSAPVTISGIGNGSVGKTVTVIIGNGNVTVDFTASGLRGNAGVDWSPVADDHMTCTFDGTIWYCDISDNTA